ncbi:hypothetical protein FOXG_22377 [Fusarium oxysporum f. sp. lycopersici 4287]|uniref:Rhodopsin domain-containing protein n=1 Tax=Fusarium oxysporum f. sp. lycopersici (strain 4287 / CBS 123668 / FGSC 9935 / NRRL 34936) TaxID=426428 RepID=A0A0J9UZV9_FUSO4|nr:hypothetical protein FOXG_19429 [Fusarium oxysporum f. sp. lycopersici 4287]XP_018256766.1 hypothetical protein FOXG_16159 [Fusarium oxysporum f. sp. lycopersici 4287]XP_018256844.1 hypothetical protein FOXG_22377 [Fusarium oxysporum f. sp. lycopersici 4287]KAJ9419111.1 hypothetical protein QL093DRAFT_2015840 [Fusarium oxysporum]KNB04844.1 hypothetical protein FOXG_19429 [Fusarium oxysporum f. sp. lycopersici 4287]KNB18721.1 hypothetical protein FOXG_16159 [Fusarium oxysporum f. sp. lycoper
MLPAMGAMDQSNPLADQRLPHGRRICERPRTINHLFNTNEKKISVFATLSFALSIVTQGKLGVHRADLVPEQHLAVVRYANFIMSAIMMLATTMVKMSITEFYLHLFPHRWIRYICYVQLVSLALFMVAQMTAYFTICRPLALVYDFSVPGKCGDLVSFWLAVTLIALFFDVSCVVLPLPIFWRMNLERNKKWKLTVLFGLGFCICGLTGLRVWVYRNIDYTDWTFGAAYGIMLTTTEPVLGIIAGCIPIMLPCFSLVIGRIKSSSCSVEHEKTKRSSGVVKVGGSRQSDAFRHLEDPGYEMMEV